MTDKKLIEFWKQHNKDIEKYGTCIKCGLRPIFVTKENKHKLCKICWDDHIGKVISIKVGDK